jgi:predicted metalloprotease
MKWQMGRRSANIVDRRGMGRSLGFGGGAISVVGLILYLLLGGDPAQLDTSGGVDPGVGGSGVVDPAQDELKEFVSVVLADTEDTWPRLLAPLGVRYAEPRLVLFSHSVQSACGMAGSAVGPFYCPLDHQVFLDLSFFRELDRLGGPGDFAQAYVVAHEVGHHVQTLLGTSQRVQAQRRRLGTEEANALSVRQELQADCFAGVWAHHAQMQRQVLEPGDIEEGLKAAEAIGDDRLQRRARGVVVPESFTHGSSNQRMEWFKRGFEQGTVEACDTFR